MTGRNHLGTTSEMLEYFTKMNDELVKHKKQKSSMRDWGFTNSMAHCIYEMEQRTRRIKKHFKKLNSFDEFNEDTKLELINTINKQFIHIGNFAMMGYLKSK